MWETAAIGTAGGSQPDIEVADHLWKEWEYRHSHFWSLFWRLGAFLVGAQSIPVIQQTVREALGPLVLVFPGVGVAGGVLGALLLLEEYNRLKPLSRALTSARMGIIPVVPGRWPIGVFAVVLFLAAVVGAALLTTVVLWQLEIANP